MLKLPPLRKQVRVKSVLRRRCPTDGEDLEATGLRPTLQGLVGRLRCRRT